MTYFSTLAFINIGPQEIIIIFLAVILLFGAKKLPELARAIGRSLGEFRKAKDELDREIQAAATEAEDEKRQLNRSDSCSNTPPGTISKDQEKQS